jgi:uncharacterized protein YkwD
MDMTLLDLARKKSKDMVDNNYFAHTSPTYGSIYDILRSAGVKYYVAGENIAKARDVNYAFIMFMGSDGHRANILYPDFTRVGIGIVHYQYGVSVTQLFIGR